MTGRERFWVGLVAFLLGAAGALILAAQTFARPKVPPDVFRAVRAEWATRPERVKAFDVVACETGGTYSLTASNGQYLGLFQMGWAERRRCGHGATARAQARAARCWFDMTGRDWSPWTCA